MRLYNTLSEEKEEILPRNGSEIRMFVCGPTVQDNVHLGHAKTYFAYDVLTRWLLKRGFKVQYILNITDVDDKIFDRAKQEKIPYMEIANRFLKEFLDDLDALNIVTVSKVERVSNHVEDAINLVRQLLRDGIAYALDGSTYFDISKADHFGKLSHQSEYQLKMKQIDAAPGKRNSVDFLLWRKFAEGVEGVWESPLGHGRPGWHIEDSAIAFSLFCGPYDIHGGATELIFPHHEAELAQDESISGEIPFVRHWVHTGLLLSEGEKMSKSLRNDIKIQDALKKTKADVLRFYFLRNHYRSSFNLDQASLDKTAEEFEAIWKARQICPRRFDKIGIKTLEQESDSFREFSEAMDDDLNTPKALQVFIQTAKKIADSKFNEGSDSAIDSAAFWHMADSLGFRLD